jgi:hypothetical protein
MFVSLVLGTWCLELSPQAPVLSLQAPVLSPQAPVLSPEATPSIHIQNPIFPVESKIDSHRKRSIVLAVTPGPSADHSRPVTKHMADKRRQFIKRSGMLLGAAALSPVSQAVAAPGSVVARTGATLPKPVTDFLTRCGAREILLRGGSVLSTANPNVSVNAVVLTADPAQFFQRAGREMPFANAYAAGGVLTFSSDASFFNVECLTKGGLGDLRSKLSTAGGVRFAHEALLQSVQGGNAFDPWSVLAPGGKTLRMTGQANLSLKEKTAALITGIVDGVVYKLQPVAAMTQFHDQVLATLPASDEEATEVADEVTAGVNRLALLSRSSTMERLFTSPLVSTSLERTFGYTGAQVLAVVKAHGASTREPGAPWLLGILGPERLRIRQGAVWIQDSDRHSFLQTKSALVTARSIANTLP